MKIGRVSETVFKRSILKQIVKQQDSVLTGVGVGENCAVFSCDGEKFSVAQASNSFKEDTREVLLTALNKLAAAGAEPIAAELSVLMPETCEEDYIKAEMAGVKALSEEYRVEITAADFKVSPKVKEPVINVTALGRGAYEASGNIAGFDVIVTKWIGLEGTSMVAKYKEKELSEKFPSRFIYDAKNFESFLSCIPDAASAIKSGVSDIAYVSEGGIFATLWEMAEKHRVGLKIELRKIPVKQETIEICNQFDLNPYQFLSGGSMLIIAEDGNRVCLDLEQAGIHATIIGKVTEGNDRIVYNEDFERFLEPAKPDELYKINF